MKELRGVALFNEEAKPRGGAGQVAEGEEYGWPVGLASG
jgi:hypothetical protein